MANANILIIKYIKSAQNINMPLNAIGLLKWLFCESAQRRHLERAKVCVLG